MQIVIDIPDKTYEYFAQGLRYEDDVEEAIIAIVDGTPLPEGHGRLIDENTITQVKFEIIEEEFETRLQGKIIHRHQVFRSADAPTIIEADKGRK